MYLIKIVMETLEYICVAPSSTTCTLSLLEFVKKKPTATQASSSSATWMSPR